MAITKSGSKCLRKQGSIAGALGIGLGVHLLQNQAVRKLMQNKEFMKDAFPKLLAHGFIKPNAKIPADIGGNVGFGIAKGAIPEVGIAYDEVVNLGRKMNAIARENGIDPSQLTMRDFAVLRRIAKNDLKGAYRLHSPNAQKLTQSFVQTLAPESKVLFENAKSAKNVVDTGKIIRTADKEYFNNNLQKEVLTNSQEIANKIQNGSANNKHLEVAKDLGNKVTNEQLDDFLDKFSDYLSENELFGNLGRAYADRKTAREIKKWVNSTTDSTSTSRIAEEVADAGTNAALLAAEPIAGVFNGIKRFAANKNLSKSKHLPDSVRKGIASAQNNLTDLFVSLPSEKAFKLGLEGQKISDKKRFFTSNFLNPMTAAIHDVANSAGRAIREAKINPKILPKIEKEDTWVRTNFGPKEKGSDMPWYDLVYNKYYKK